VKRSSSVSSGSADDDGLVLFVSKAVCFARLSTGCIQPALPTVCSEPVVAAIQSDRKVTW